MKKILMSKALKPGEGAPNKVVEIETPWLQLEEAAAYCGISRSEFYERAGLDLPYQGPRGRRTYHVNVLDAFVKDEYPNCPFSHRRENKNEIGAPPRRRSRGFASDLIADPLTGRIPGMNRKKNRRPS